MKKIVLNQNIVKIISTLFIAVVIIIIDSVLTNGILNKVKKQTKDLYETSCSNIAEGYSQSIKCRLNEYISGLNFFIDEPQVKTFKNG